MGLSAPGGDRLVIVGHLVFQESRDGGATWADIPADLPSLDIHAFVPSHVDPDRMWAYLPGSGVYVSADGGIEWTRVFPARHRTHRGGRDGVDDLHGRASGPV